MSRPLVVGPAVKADAEALGGILSDWIDATPWMPRIRGRDEVRAHVADLIGTGRVLVLRDGTRARGFLFEEGGHIGALYLAPGIRGRGAGKRLLDRVKADCDRLDLWTFAANTGARRFYAREGFREVERSEGDNAEGLPDIRMVWQRK